MYPDSVRPLSDALFEPVSKAYRVGGFGVVFLALGTFLMLASGLADNNWSGRFA